MRIGGWAPDQEEIDRFKKKDVQVVIINKNFIIMIRRNLSVICLLIGYWTGPSAKTCAVTGPLAKKATGQTAKQ